MNPLSRCWARSIGKLVTAVALCLCLPGAMPDSSAGAGATVVCPEVGVVVPPGDEDPDYRCALLTRLIEGGLNLGGGIGRQVLAEIARPYVTVFEVAGDALLPGPALRFLLEELPDTARMINFYENTRYEVAWLTQDRSRFIATNNRTLQATFKRFKTRTADGAGDYLLFESGSAKLLFWQLNGNTIVDLHLEPRKRATRYNIKIHIFTDSPGFHSFFESGLFRYLARTMVQGIIGDMVEAANKLAESRDALPTLSPDFASKHVTVP
jgi:hypothetical protein